MNNLRCVHCVGIGGSGMQALAELLLRAGVRVSGSDLETSPTIRRLRRLGCEVSIGHAAEQVPQADHLVYSPAIGPDNAERRRAEQMGIPQYSYPEMLGKLMATRAGVAIAGSHGKSTTSAMVGWVLTHAGLDPTVVVGSDVPQLGGPSRVGSGEHFVAEACEYKRSFLQLVPKHAVVTSIEADHLDYYSGLDEIVSSFAQFAANVPSDGTILLGVPGLAERLGAEASAEIQTFSLDAGADWWGADLRQERGRYRFRVFHRGEFVTQITLQVPGRHNVLNALAATAVCHNLGVSPGRIREALAEFGGCNRRLENLGIWRGATLIDDYAHHPTEVRAALETIREMYGNRKIRCVFQPHQVARMRDLYDGFITSFDVVDELIVSDVYTARESLSVESTVIARRLAEDVATRVSVAQHMPDTESITSYFEATLDPGDVLVTLGAGDVWKVTNEFARRLSRYRQAG